jgi:hypothetical protein
MTGAVALDTVPTRRPADEALVEVLDRLAARSAAYFGASPVSFRTLSHVVRPYSDVTRIDVAGAGTPARIFVKIFRPRSDAPGEIEFMARRVQKDFDTTRRLHAALERSPGLGVVRPIACFPDCLAMVTAEAPGDTMLVTLEREARWWPRPATLDRLAEALSRVGRWLAAFQATGTGHEPLSLAEVETYLDVRLRRLVERPRARVTEASRAAILEAFARRRARVPDAHLASVPVHADLAMGNILADTAGITVLDLAMSGSGCRYHDLAHLHMQLELLAAKPAFRPRTIAALQRALLAGYEPGLEAGAPLFELMLLQHRACHLLGLVERRAGRLEGLYNRHVARRHGAWLREFIDRD